MRVLLFSLLLFCVHSYGQKAEKEHQPRYPTSPVCRDDAGLINLNFHILESGKPHKIEIETTDSVRFSRSAIKTLSMYQFKLGTFDTGTKYQKVFQFKPDFQCDKNS